MKIKGKEFKNSIFTRLFFTFVLIMFPMVLVGYGIYSWGTSTVKEEITNSMNAQVEFFMGNVEDELIRINTLQFELADNLQILELATSNFDIANYQRDLNANITKESLNYFKSSSSLIDEVSLYLVKQNKFMSSLDSVRNMTLEDLEFVEDFVNTPFTQLAWYNNSLYLNGNTLPYFITSVDLSEEGLRESIKVSLRNEEEGSFLFSEVLDFTIGADGSLISNKIKECIMTGVNKCGTDMSKSIDEDRGNFSIEIDNTDYIVAFKSSAELDLMFVAYTPEHVIYEKVENYKAWIWTLSLLTAVLIMAIFSISAYRVVHLPLSRLLIAFNRVEQGDMSVRIEHGYKGEFRYIFESFNKMVNNLKSLIDQAYKQKILVQRAELKQLQSQINPHFLYNSFFVLHRRIKSGDLANAELFSQHLGSYFQFISRSGVDEVELRHEVEHARIYAEIQAARFSNRISLSFDSLPTLYEGYLVPRLIMQPIIENSFEHGLEDLESGGILEINFEGKEREHGREIRIIVEDNGRKLRDMELKRMQDNLNNEDENIETTGIINIHRRIRLKFGEESGILLSHGKNGGLKVTLVIFILFRQ